MVTNNYGTANAVRKNSLTNLPNEVVTSTNPNEDLDASLKKSSVSKGLDTFLKKKSALEDLDTFLEDSLQNPQEKNPKSKSYEKLDTLLEKAITRGTSLDELLDKVI